MIMPPNRQDRPGAAARSSDAALQACPHWLCSLQPFVWRVRDMRFRDMSITCMFLIPNHSLDHAAPTGLEKFFGGTGAINMSLLRSLIGAGRWRNKRGPNAPSSLAKRTDAVPNCIDGLCVESWNIDSS